MLSLPRAEVEKAQRGPEKEHRGFVAVEAAGVEASCSPEPSSGKLEVAYNRRDALVAQGIEHWRPEPHHLLSTVRNAVVIEVLETSGGRC